MAADSEVYNARLIHAVKQGDTETIKAFARVRFRAFQEDRLAEFEALDHYRVVCWRPIVALSVSVRVNDGGGSCTIDLCTVACARANGLLKLEHAIQLGDEELFEERLRLDDVNDMMDGSLLVRALEKRHTYMVRKLLDHGARVDCMHYKRPMNACQTEEHARMLCAQGEPMGAHRCYRVPDDPVASRFLKFANVFYLADAPPCEHPMCPLKAFQGQVLTLQRQCSNQIRREKLDTSLLPQAMADAVASFGL